MKQFLKKYKWVLLVVIIAIIGGGAYLFFNSHAPRMDGFDGFYSEEESNNFYMGVVEAKQSVNINKDMSREIAEVKVNVGDEVKAGDVLFTYTSTDINAQLASSRIELESLYNDIDEYNYQINEYKRKSEQADSEEMRLEYQVQIAQLNVSLKQTRVAIQTKEIDIGNLEAKLKDGQVVSPIDGIIQSVNGQESFISILSTGAFRIKGTIDELHVYMIQEGMNVTIHSRVDDTIWQGVIDSVNTDQPAQNNDPYYYDDRGDSATKYNFYVTLNESEGLMMGQHVYIEVSDMMEDLVIDEMPIVEEGGE